MKTQTSLILAAVVLALSVPSFAWVARGGAYHAGYSCGGVVTGTRSAYGYHDYAARTAVGVATAPYYVAPVYGYGTTYSVSPPPPPPVPPVNTPSVGTIVYSLPPGAQATVVNGIRYYVVTTASVTTYYQPFFGNNGVYYVVQAGPS